MSSRAQPPRGPAPFFKSRSRALCGAVLPAQCRALRRAAASYMYFYGLFCHKLAHFFDVVHGTRHDFFMNEFRIDTLFKWIALLHKKGWDPAELEQGPFGEKFLKDVVL